MKTVFLALFGLLIGGGVGTGGGAFLLARCASDPVEAHGEESLDHGDESEEPDAAVLADEENAEPDTAGSMGPLPDLSGEGADAAIDSSAVEEVEAAASDDVGADEPSAGPDAADDDVPPPGAVDPAAPAVEPIVLAPTPDPTALRRLARIFSNMKAEQAAAVMVELSDAEAQRILVSMSERAAAAILGKMDATRAAVLSRRVLGAGQGGDDR